MNAAAAAAAGVTQSSWMEETIDIGHTIRTLPPVNLFQQVREHEQWASDEYVLRVARQKFGVFTSTTPTGAAYLEQCLPEEFVCVHEPLGVMACLKHMVVHRCGESWQRVRRWIDLCDEASLQCRRIVVGGSNELDWCCAFSRKRLHDADVLKMTSSKVETLNDLAVMVYGTGVQPRERVGYKHVLIGGTMGQSGKRKRCFDDAFHFGEKRYDLLRQTIHAVVRALIDPEKRTRYNKVIRERGSKGKLLQLQNFTPGIQLLLQNRLMELCQRLLPELKMENKDFTSLVFFALNIVIDGPQLGPDVVVPRLPVSQLAPLPIETLFEQAFGLMLFQYSKMATKIQRVTGNPRFAQSMGWCTESTATSFKY